LKKPSQQAMGGAAANMLAKVQTQTLSAYHAMVLYGITANVRVSAIVHTVSLPIMDG